MVRAGKACRRGRSPGGGGFTLIELLVVMGIMMVLAGMITSAVFAFRRITQKKGAGVDIQTFTMGLAAYRKDLGAYPPDDIMEADGTPTAKYGFNEVIYHFLGTRLVKGANLYGPYVTFKTKRLVDEDGDGFMEYLDTFGTHYNYALRPNGEYDIVSPGPDGEFGGTIAVGTGFVPAEPASPHATDNITQRSE